VKLVAVRVPEGVLAVGADLGGDTESAE
jgi:hypothetical protein